MLENQQCLKRLLYGFTLLRVRGVWKIRVSLEKELGSVCKVQNKHVKAMCNHSQKDNFSPYRPSFDSFSISTMDCTVSKTSV